MTYVSVAVIKSKSMGPAGEPSCNKPYCSGLKFRTTIL